jgi:type II secretory pathway predicted ATPase ExeA
MYVEHFGLCVRPFGITPNAEFFYPGCRRGEILDALLYAVGSGEGIVKVVGEVGSGKTMLCRVLDTRLPGHVDSIHVLNPSLGRDEMLHTIAEELGIEVQPDERAGNILRLLRERLIAAYTAGRQVVLFIDEAQAVPLDTLEEVRLLSNLETDTHKLLQIVLFGQPELDQNLALPRMRQIRERITHSFNLPPMTREVVGEYVMFRMRTAGYRGPDPFSREAIRMIAVASRGVTRLINILADKSLLAAFAADIHRVGKAHVHVAIRDSSLADMSSAPWHGAGWWAVGASAVLIAMAALLMHAAVEDGASMQILQGVAAAVPDRFEVEAGARVGATGAGFRPDSAEDAVRVEAQRGPEPLPSGGLLERRLAQTARWLAATPEHHWTIQLGLAENTGLAERFIVSAQADLTLGQLHVYRANTIGGRYAIAYGGFADRSSAASALAALPDRYRAWGAYLRTVRAIHRTMAESVALQ